MRAGRMDRIITLKEKFVTTDAFGEEIVTWGDIATVWAERRELKGSERWQSLQVISKVACKYRIRYRDDVGPLNMLVDGDIEYDIQAALELGRKDGLELLVAARGE